MKYHVTVERIEHITFEVDADTPEQADDLALCGEEIASHTESTNTLLILEVKEG